MTVSLKAVASTLGACAAIAAVGAWIARAEDSHDKSEKNAAAIERIIELEEAKEQRAALAAARREEKDATRREACAVGDIRPGRCLELGIPYSGPPAVSAGPDN